MTVIPFPARVRTAPVEASGLTNEQSELLAASRLLLIASKRPEKREEIAERVADFLASIKGGVL